MLLRENHRATDFGDGRSSGAGTGQSDEVRAPIRDVATHVLESILQDRHTTIAQASVAVLLSRGSTLTNDAVRYDPETGELHADGEELRVRVERSPTRWLTWTGYYTLVALVAFASIAAQWVGLYTLSEGETVALLLGALLFLGASVAYQRHTRIDVPVVTDRQRE
jgi:hypothetical protein